jgi:hypothetical protein
MREFPFSLVSHIQLTMFALAITVLITFRISEPLLLATCITAQLKCVLLKKFTDFFFSYRFIHHINFNENRVESSSETSF